MKLTFHSHISSKTHRDFWLKMFPEAEPDNFSTRTDEEEGGEMTAWSCEYDFPDDAVVVARTEFGPALADPDAPGRVGIEIHIGPQANASVIEEAEADARQQAQETGANVDEDSIEPSALQIIRH